MSLRKPTSPLDRDKLYGKLNDMVLVGVGRGNRVAPASAA